MADLYVEACEFQTFGSKQDVVVSRELDDYYTAFLRPYEMAIEPSALRAGRNNDFLDMGKRLARAIRARRPITDVDLLILAHDTPNTLYPFRSVTASLAHELNIAGTAFAISEQGTAAPFIALALAKKYAEQGACKRALVFVLDQTTLAYAAHAGTEKPKDAGVGLMLGTDAALGRRLRHAQHIYVGTGAGGVASALEKITAYIGYHCGKHCRVVVNPALAELASGDGMRGWSIADATLLSAAALSSLCAPTDVDDLLLVHLGSDGQLYFLLFDKG